MSRVPLVVPKQKLLPNVVEVLRLITEYAKPSWEYDKYCVKYNTSSRSLVHDVCKAISTCLASHRFADAGILLNALGQQTNMIDLFFFKAALIVLENDPMNTTSSVLDFMRMARELKAVYKSEVILESIIYALRKNEINEQFNFKTFIIEDNPNKSSKIIQSFIINPLVGAYLGMFDYVRWCQNKDVTSAEAAIKSFSEAIEVPGQWDIFVLKLVEMLVFYDRVSEAEEALTKYADLNPEHINSHIYLSTFLQQTNPESEKLLDNLKEIAEKCPSDPRVLTLAELLEESGSEDSLELLLMFLDYPVNSENLKAWKLLYNLLVHMMENKVVSGIEDIYTQWNTRKEFWPSIHFNGKHLSMTDKKSCRVPFQKASVLCLFENCHTYTHAVLHQLKTISRKLHNKLLKRISYINELRITVNNIVSEMSMDFDPET